MQEKHQEMVAAGEVVTVPESATDEVAQSYPDLRHIKKSERNPILKQKIRELKDNLREMLSVVDALGGGSRGPKVASSGASSATTGDNIPQRPNAVKSGQSAPASYADTLREMHHPGARQPTFYADDLAHINELLQNAALSPRDQAYIQEDIADAQRSCDAAMKAIVNPNATAEERAQAVRRAIDALDYARQRINDLGLPATQLGVSTAQDTLADIAERLKPYLLQEERGYESEIGAQDGLASSYEDMYNAGGASSSVDESASAWQSGSSSTQMPNYSDAVTPREKFVNYSLDYENKKAAGKAEAYERTLGYTKENADDLIDQIHKAVTSGKTLPYATEATKYGTKYKFRFPITGPNGKTKNVIAVYQIDVGATKPRLVTNYVEAK